MFIINAQKIKGNTSKGMRGYIEDKLAFLDNEENVKITVEKEHELIKVSAAFVDKFNHHYYISTKRPDFYEAIDRLKDKCNREIREYAKKAKKIKDIPDFLESYDEEIIGKEKLLIADEMSTEEAAYEMCKLGHNWFVFRDIDTKEICVLYLRYKDGFGLMRVR